MNQPFIDNLGMNLGTSFQTIGLGFTDLAPKLIVAIIIFIAGWVVAAILGRVVDQIIKTLKIDNILKSAGVEDLLTRGGFQLNAGGFLGALVKWFIIVVFLTASLQIVGLTQVNQFLQDVVLMYLPHVIAAALILMIAAVVADVVQKVVVGSAKAAGIKTFALLGSLTRWAIWIFAILIALSQLQIASDFMQILFTGIVAMLALAGGLAFGLGGRDTAAHILENLRKDISSNHHG